MSLDYIRKTYGAEIDLRAALRIKDVRRYSLGKRRRLQDRIRQAMSKQKDRAVE